MPVNPVTGERLPYPGDAGIEATNQAMGLGGPPMAGPEMSQPGGRLAQLLEARQMIDQEIAAIVGGPVDAENLDMLPPPPVNPMAQMPPEAMMGPGGSPVPPQGPPMPPMGLQGLLGV